MTRWVEHLGRWYNSIDSHLRKGNDYTIIDATGYNADQIDGIAQYLDGLPAAQQAMIRRVGF